MLLINNEDKLIFLYLSKQEMLAFQTSGGIEVKKYVTHFMEVAWYVAFSINLSELF